MNYGPLIFLTAFFALASSWYGLVLTPQMQIGRLTGTNTVPSGPLYPVSRPGLAREGSDVYRANGCAYCHTQQAQQSAVTCDLVLNEAGTNQASMLAAISEVDPTLTKAQATQLLSTLPQTILHGVKKETADVAAKALKAAEAKVQI